MTKLVWVAAAIALGACDDHSAWCDGNVTHNCSPGRSGQVCTEMDCGERFCNTSTDEEGPVAFCAAEPTPNDLCQDPIDGATWFWTCDGAQVLKCLHGYVLEKTDCGDASLCLSGVPECLVRPGVDPTCAAQIADHNYSTSYCEGTVLVDCWREYATELRDCSPQQCIVESSSAVCR